MKTKSLDHQLNRMRRMFAQHGHNRSIRMDPIVINITSATMVTRCCKVVRQLCIGIKIIAIGPATQTANRAVAVPEPKTQSKVNSSHQTQRQPLHFVQPQKDRLASHVPPFHQMPSKRLTMVNSKWFAISPIGHGIVPKAANFSRKT